MSAPTVPAGMPRRATAAVIDGAVWLVLGGELVVVGVLAELHTGPLAAARVRTPAARLPIEKPRVPSYQAWNAATTSITAQPTASRLEILPEDAAASGPV